MSLTVGTIASGIGGWELGLERAGMRAVWHCEIEPFCQRVLRKHWPHNPIYEDANAQDWTEVEPVDVLAAGYPCQPFSVAGQRAGFDDERNLWPAVARAIRDIRPRYVLLENVRGHLSMGFGRVLGDLARLGYDAEWDVLAARDFGAPHKRDRVWIVAWDANADSSRRQGRAGAERQADRRAEPAHVCDDAANSDRRHVREQQISKSGRVGVPLARRDGEAGDAVDANGWNGDGWPVCAGGDQRNREDARRAQGVDGAGDAAQDGFAANPDGPRLRDRVRSGPGERPPTWGGAANPDSGNGDQRRGHVRAWQPEPAWGGQTYAAPGRVSARWREWHEEGVPPVSPVCGMDDGVSRGMDRKRLKALGNALVPDIAEWIGRRVLAVCDELAEQGGLL